MIADLHIHSRFSRATSKDCDAVHLDLWARRKGIGLVGTGDFTHPAWRAELREQLVPGGDGFYTLKDSLRLEDGTQGAQLPRFVLTAEISSIYKKKGRVRKVHNLILLPDLEAADNLSARLEAIGNIHSDGRPILGLDCRDLLEITLDCCPEAIFIPAHIWTPHFSLFGAFSGFDCIEDCFEDLTPHIHALETGLSSDPPMNWRVSALDRFTLVSNSDAHSPQKLGREANLLSRCGSFGELATAICTGRGFEGTLEFFPEEGKYHLDGHRACQLCLTPAQTAAYGGKCPVCGKKLTIGVEHRVEELADRPAGGRPANPKPFERLAPLPEVIAASTGRSAASAKTQETYLAMLRKLGPEFKILREIPPEEIEEAAGPCIAEGIRRLRRGKAEWKAGFDGQYGVFSLLTPDEIESLGGQMSLFALPCPKPEKKASPAGQSAPRPGPEKAERAAAPSAEKDALNPEQQRAVTALEPSVAVIAGPGTGKTKTLVSRIAWLVEEQGVSPSQITAVTFTNQAAAEMRQRLSQRLGGPGAIKEMTIGTFHAICRKRLAPVRLLGQQEAMALAREVLASLERKEQPRGFLERVSQMKSGILPQEEDPEALEAYERRLGQLGVLDFDDLLIRGLQRQDRFPYVLVDEFQDVSGLQYRLALSWSREGNLFVIGDPDQAIYGFRGASSHCFERLRTDRPGLTQIHLVQNYRSSPQILAAALPMISQNPGEPRLLQAVQPDGPAVRLVQTGSDLWEGIFIAKEISRMTGGVDMLDSEFQGDRTVFRSFSDIAVLCRTHRQMAALEKCLRHDSIPCLIVGQEDFLEDDGVRGTLGFLRFLLDTGDLPSLKAALELIWRCPPDLILAVEDFCRLHSPAIGQLWEAFQDRPPLRPFLDAARQFSPLIQTEKPRRVLEQWAGGRLLTPALEKLRNMAVFYEDTAAFLSALLLGSEGDLRRAAGREYASGAVRLMTLHGAKGLEFPVVLMAGVRAGTLPLEAKGHPTDMEEERRLFYVGMTRAREELLLLTSGEPSCFLAGIPRESLLRESAVRPAPQAEQLSLF